MTRVITIFSCTNDVHKIVIIRWTIGAVWLFWSAAFVSASGESSLEAVDRVLPQIRGARHPRKIDVERRVGRGELADIGGGRFLIDAQCHELATRFFEAGRVFFAVDAEPEGRIPFGQSVRK